MWLSVEWTRCGILIAALSEKKKTWSGYHINYLITSKVFSFSAFYRKCYRSAKSSTLIKNFVCVSIFNEAIICLLSNKCIIGIRPKAVSLYVFFLTLCELRCHKSATIIYYLIYHTEFIIQNVFRICFWYTDDIFRTNQCWFQWRHFALLSVFVQTSFNILFNLKNELTLQF